MFSQNLFKFATHPKGDKSIPKDHDFFSRGKKKKFLCVLSNALAISTEFGGLRSYEFDFRREPLNGDSDWLDIFMMLHRPDTEMKEAPLEGLSVLIRGHYLYAVSGSWLVTSQ